MRRQTNQNNRFFDRCKPLRTNVVTPEIIVGPIWLHDEQPSSIEIIELNSSNEVEGSPRVNKETNYDNKDANAWAHDGDNYGIEQIGSRFPINKKAREKQRLQNENHFAALTSAYSTDANNHNEDFENNFYTNHSTNHIHDNLKFNHQMNCFTIFNKHYLESETDTSNERDCGEVEFITSSDMILDGTNWEPQNNDLYNEEIFTYGTDIDHETRTIWIYSNKNKHLLSDDDIAVNEPSKETLSTSTTQSTDSSGDRTADKSTSACRLGSPIPPTYIPRLDLSLVPTLSTVTELSERNAQPTPKESIKSINSNTKKPENNWFISESAKLDGAKSVRKHEKSTNIINWMALSPRERRRVLKENSSSDRWMGSRLNLVDNTTDDRGDQTNEVIQNDSVKVLVDVEVHADVNKKADATESKNSNVTPKPKAHDMITVNKIKYADDCEEFQKDRGDHYVKLVVAPAIKIKNKKKQHEPTEITNPIETLESSNWIRDCSEERVTNVYDYELDAPEPIPEVRNTRNAIDQMWMRNSVSFLQPSQWTAFAPTSESPVSLHLSLGSIIEERQTWFKRLLNCIKCCK